ncbi:NrfD/PsrC family molybdoenzyme membrane anchor subunit [Paraferrimonas haliotis]|uniref:Menaquinol oxidase SirD n=1 Tax=Paraferrimonas haliotis TaxID=2013866 RepID=A0AA37WWB9_9GAMM|nr:NrfD/PsrC family molybdoenzyme membrane anchor subunit [Paraferrimonas haliotis]GLS82234.1 menaquinol oxidase SirD [Paraferrimonas haliotis]
MDGSLDFTIGLSDGVAWPWPIAVYLFLAGISGGALIIALAIRFFKGQTENTPLYKAATLISFITISLGMLCLVLDLSNPLFFWRILVFYNLNSVMSIGVLALLLYIPITVILCLYAFEEEIRRSGPSFLVGIIEALKPLRGKVEALAFVLAIAVCAYTGFLISALIRFPLINTAVLPALFVASGLSAGAASAKLIAVKYFGEELHSKDMHTLHGAEWPIMAAEVLFIAMIAIALAGGNAAGQYAFQAFTTGVWSSVFWIGVVAVGFLGPIIVNFGLGRDFAQSSKALYMSCLFAISGMMCLRLFILYAGQTYGI